MSMNDRKLRIAMIGGGQGSMMGPVHRAALRITNRYELVAGAFSTQHDKSLALGETLGIPPDNIYEDWHSLAESSDRLKLDAVAILTPNDTHVEIARAFADRGVHIMCEKPLGTSLAEALQLKDSIESNGLAFALAHAYAAYPSVLSARQLILDGKIGNVRSVSVEYMQGWLAEKLEDDLANRGAVWREDSSRGGAGGLLGDIGTHAFHLLEFVTNLEARKLLAVLSSIPGRAVPDEANVLLKLSNGATANMCCSQVALGEANGLRIRVFGEQGSIEWSNDSHEVVHLFDAEQRKITLNKPAHGALPAGHPEGYCEAFARLYDQFADKISSRSEAGRPDTLPGIDTGIQGLRFIEVALQSSRNESAWMTIESSRKSG